MAIKKSKPKFNVLNAGFKKRVKHRWRKPRGIDNKKRIRLAWAGASPRIGYKNAVEVRGMHPSGLFEVLIHNVAELRAVPSSQSPVSKPGTENGKRSFAARIASGVGKKKRDEIKKAAAELKIPVLN